MTSVEDRLGELLHQAAEPTALMVNFEEVARRARRRRVVRATAYAGAVGAVVAGGAAGVVAFPDASPQRQFPAGPAPTASTAAPQCVPPGKITPVVLPDITYPSSGINVSAAAPSSPGRLAPDASSPARVLASLKRQGYLGTHSLSQVPVIKLRLVTELWPKVPGVTAGKPFTAWVVIYRNTTAPLLGTQGGTVSGVTFVGIMDATTGVWTDFFQYANKPMPSTTPGRQLTCRA